MQKLLPEVMSVKAEGLAYRVGFTKPTVVSPACRRLAFTMLTVYIQYT